MLKFLPVLLLFLPVVALAQDHCPCMDRANSEPPEDQFFTSLDNSLALQSNTPVQTAAPLRPVVPEEAPAEPAIDLESQRPEVDTSDRSSALRSKRKRARKPSRKGMKKRKKARKYRGQCPWF